MQGIIWWPLLHVDDINLCNPLGSKRKKHSMRIFQWELLNLPSWYRSKLEGKRPLAIANASSFKTSPERAWKIILEDFLNVLKEHIDGGLFVPLLNEKNSVKHGSLLGDGLGIFEILGLTMSFGKNSKYVCFRCDASGGANLNGKDLSVDLVRTRERILAGCVKLSLAPEVKTRPTVKV